MSPTAYDHKRIDREVGARVRARRRGLGISQAALGDAIGISFQQVQKYENGANRISASSLVAIADVLKTKPYALLDRIGAEA